MNNKTPSFSLFNNDHQIWKKSFKSPSKQQHWNKAGNDQDLHMIEEESNEAESIYINDIKKLTESEKREYIKLIDNRYPKQQNFFFILMYKLNPYRKNKPFLRCIISFLRFFFLTIALLFEVYYDIRGLFMIPLVFGIMLKLIFSIYQACV